MNSCIFFCRKFPLTDNIGRDPLVPGVDPDVAALVLPCLHRDQHQVELYIADLRYLGEGLVSELVYLVVLCHCPVCLIVNATVSEF